MTDEPDWKKMLGRAQILEIPVQYPGVIDRQALVDFCQGELPRLVAENHDLAMSIDIMERSRAENIHTIHALNEGLAENIGYQKALRAVCEWAREHQIEEPAIGDAEDQINAMKDQLRQGIGR